MCSGWGGQAGEQTGSLAYCPPVGLDPKPGPCLRPRLVPRGWTGSSRCYPRPRGGVWGWSPRPGLSLTTLIPTPPPPVLWEPREGGQDSVCGTRGRTRGSTLPSFPICHSGPARRRGDDLKYSLWGRWAPDKAGQGQWVSRACVCGGPLSTRPRGQRPLRATVPGPP